MTRDDLTMMLQALDGPQAAYSRLDAYYEGRQPMAFLSPEARDAIGNRWARMVSNLPRLAVTALAERLRVTGFSAAGAGPISGAWDIWTRNNLDQLAGVAHREALALGESFLLVWAGPGGDAQVTVESARQVAVATDPATRQVTMAVKRWEAGGATHAVLYEADRITWFRAENVGATAGFKETSTIPNPLGHVPVVPLVNSDRLLSAGTSEMADMVPLCDALNKALADLMVASEYFARPRRWATGIELVEDENGVAENPFPEGHRMMVSESADTKFGQLPAADLASYEAAVKVLLGQIMAMGALPAHYVGVFTDQPASADALRAAEASLAARAAARQSTFGPAWEHAMSLAVAVETGELPEDHPVTVQWADPATRSVAQEADAVTKLHAAGIISTAEALRRMGYDDATIQRIRADRRAEALDGAGIDLNRLVAE